MNKINDLQQPFVFLYLVMLLYSLYQENKPMKSDYRRTRLLQDGHKANAMIKAGRSMSDVRMVIAGSRARLYRAMALARDPLLL